MNAKSPPPWDPAMSPFYPFRRYAKDLILWSLGADVQQQQQAASAVLQLSGGARALADELNVTLLMVGQQADWGDGRGDVIHPGIEILLRRLGERFGELESEMIIRILTDFLSYVRSPHQDIDAALTQFDILYARAVESASMSVSPSILAYFLLSAMLIGPKAWPMLFYP